MVYITTGSAVFGPLLLIKWKKKKDFYTNDLLTDDGHRGFFSGFQILLNFSQS